MARERICFPNCARSIHGDPLRCSYEAARNVVNGAYLDAQTCEDMRKPGMACGPTGKKFQGVGW